MALTISSKLEQLGSSTIDSLSAFRCERRLPLFINGMMIKGAGPPSRQTPISLRTLG